MDIRVLVVPADEDQAPYVKDIEDYNFRSGQQIVGGLLILIANVREWKQR